MLIRDFNEYGAIFNGSGVAVEENEVDQLNLNIRFFFLETLVFIVHLPKTDWKPLAICVQKGVGCWTTTRLCFSYSGVKGVSDHVLGALL